MAKDVWSDEVLDPKEHELALLSERVVQAFKNEDVDTIRRILGSVEEPERRELVDSLYGYLRLQHARDSKKMEKVLEQCTGGLGGLGGYDRDTVLDQK